MARYGAQFRNKVVWKLISVQNKSVAEVPPKFGISTATTCGWKAKMNNGTLQVTNWSLKPRPVKYAVSV